MNETKIAIIKLLSKEVEDFKKCAEKGLDCTYFVERLNVYERILNTVYNCDLIFTYKIRDILNSRSVWSFACYSRKVSKFIAIEKI